jgi:hypothetical protein
MTHWIGVNDEGIAHMLSRKEPRALTDAELHALNASAFAAENFEPFVGRIIATDVLDRVIEKGWVEAGRRPAVGKIGYRLTADGWVKFNPSQNGSEAVDSNNQEA